MLIAEELKALLLEWYREDDPMDHGADAAKATRRYKQLGALGIDPYQEESL